MKSEVSYDEFAKLELRVGKVVAAELPEWSEKLIRYEVDLGEEVGRRVMFSGIREWYGVEDLMEKKFVFVVNMTYKKMGAEESQGMMLMAEEDGRIVLMPVSSRIKVGSVVR